MRLSRASLAALVLVLAGCGGSSGPAPRTVAAKCGDAAGVDGKAIWLHTTDGQRLYAVEAGSGRTAVVLVPESPPGDVCGWLPFMAALQRAGFRVLAYDYRGTGDSPVTATRPYAFGRDLTAAVARVQSDGADKVFAAGASFGGVVVMQHAGELDLDGVVSFSGERALPEYHVEAIGAVPQLHAPLLIVGSRQDSYLPVPDARRLLARAGSADKQLELYPGNWHGWDIVQAAPYEARARARVLAWLRAH